MTDDFQGSEMIFMVKLFCRLSWWSAIYTLYIHQNICKFNECIKLIFVSFKIGHYLCMHRLADKRTQWPTLFRQWFCNSEANRHEICKKLRQRVKIKILRISPECVKFHSMKLTMMFKLNFEKIRSSPLDLGASRVKAKSQYMFPGKWPLTYIS